MKKAVQIRKEKEMRAEIKLHTDKSQTVTTPHGPHPVDQTKPIYTSSVRRSV